MTPADKLKQDLHVAIERLPEDRLQPVFDLVNQLLSDEHIEPKAQTTEPEPDPSDDPLLRYIGGVANGALAQDIDEELYGLIMVEN